MIQNVELSLLECPFIQLDSGSKCSTFLNSNWYKKGKFEQYKPRRRNLCRYDRSVFK
jgi:hypothetical protein